MYKLWAPNAGATPKPLLIRLPLAGIDLFRDKNMNA